MDLLADVLRQAGLKSRILCHRSVGVPSTLVFPCSKSLGFHVVTQGRAFVYTASHAEPIALQRGDIALMARGCDHTVSTENVDTLPSVAVLSVYDAPTTLAPGQSPLLTLVSGAYQVWNTPVHPFFDELPPWYLLRAQDNERFDTIDQAIQMLATETVRGEVGSDTVIQALLDILFTHIVRKIIARQDAQPQSWAQGLRHVQIKAALELLHADCAREWTLDALARQVGLSRSGLALKFKQAVGSAPLQYLTTIRIQKAIHLLSTTTDKLETVSQAVGYKDAFGFSKAFKKLTGQSPREFRQHDDAQKASEWRFV